jgi:hypothetical protein
VAILIIGIISVIITELLVFNTATTAAYSKFGKQQFTVHDAYTRLHRDIEAAAKVWFADYIGGYDYKTIILEVDGEYREWMIEDGTLYLDSVAVVDGLTDKSRFVYRKYAYDSSEYYLTVILEPKQTNEGRYAANMSKPIVSHYSMKFKK